MRPWNAVQSSTKNGITHLVDTAAEDVISIEVIAAVETSNVVTADEYATDAICVVIIVVGLRKEKQYLLYS